ncbi:MAG: PIG-L deacetylase family protein [Gemmatimonadota bacterium]|jgi:LmbE family N-acetylglucosaminyl deacetylase
MDDLRGRSLLAVFAHPDDESLACGGLLALCADRGVRVSLLCLTRGEHGPGADAAHPPAHARDSRGDMARRHRAGERRGREDGEPTLGEIRAGELHDAARVLGIERVEILDHEDGMLPWLDDAALESDIGAAIRCSAAEVVVTFDEDGLYWHPDHVAVHERTTAAVAALGPDGPALRYVAIPPGVMRAVATAGTGGAILGVEDVDGFGASAPAPSFVLDVGPVAERKLAALCCHRSQVEGGPLDAIEPRDAPRLLGMEHYRHAEVGSADPAFIDALAVCPARV